MKRAIAGLALAVVVFAFAAVIHQGVAQAAEVCNLMQTTYGQAVCDSDDWCWWYDGQFHIPRTRKYYCTMDNGQTWYYKYIDDTVLGDCCDL